jgi:hypothetical protein
MMRFGKTCVVITVVLAGLVVYMTIEAQQSQEKNSGSKVIVGTFDSRVLALAYYRSEASIRQLGEMKAEYEKAKAAGDEKRAKELEAEGPAQQELMHKQVFSTWPVDNILKMVEGNIPEIAKQANVDVIVSKWDIVFQQSGIEFIDLTDLMVQPFNPDEETLKIIEEAKKQDPVALEELENHQH